jgi:hypothetical protein
MKKIILATLALTIALPALADKIEITEEVLAEITNANAVKDARVYISETLRIERATALQKKSEVDDSISRVVKQNILKEEISKKVRGKILAVEGDDTIVQHPSVGEAQTQIKTIYVTFDPSCEVKECAFKFQRSSTVDSNREWKYNSETGSGQYYYTYFNREGRQIL